ncbi:MAG: helix-hairpin-helix domain-containing protein [Clostridiales bacterium]|jgi:competence protein ComEA|nr:helix-hairpin-helix domain-containing protein [Clostridiales bacterium]
MWNIVDSVKAAGTNGKAGNAEERRQAMDIVQAVKDVAKDKSARKVILVFAVCALAITGYFLSKGMVGGNGGITVIAAGGNAGVAPGQAGGDPGGGLREAGGAADSQSDGRDGSPAGEGGEGGEDSAAGGAGGMDNGGGNGAGAASDAGGTLGAAPGGSRYVSGYGDAGAEAGDGDAEMIYVYVTGAVRNPGVYVLERYCMIVDAVDAAGGFADDADEENVNMVYKLENNAMLNIRRAGADGEGEAGAEGGSAESKPHGGGASISEGYDGVLVSVESRAGESGAAGAQQKLVNINTADAELLTTLPGIGKSTAEKIVEYRESHNAFASIEDLMNINGIKEAKFSAIKDLITV